MDAQEANLSIEVKDVTEKGTATVFLRRDDELLAADTIQVLKAKDRRRFVDDVVGKYPGIGRDDLEEEILRQVNRVTDTSNHAPDAGTELNVSRIIRPELFHLEEVSGLSIPVCVTGSDGPIGRWQLYLRWSDGRRECQELEESIKLTDGTCVWMHPLPAAPSLSTAPGWSKSARQEWLDGSQPPDPADLFKRLCEHIARFLEFQGETASGDIATVTLWTWLTYVYPAWSAVPYLRIGGPIGSGKSQVFAVLSRLVCRPVLSSNMTAACVFRTLHETGGVLLLDEAERLRERSPEVGELRSVLLSGYKAGSPARRLEKVGDRFRPVEFNVYGPKALACIARLPEALTSRCIELTMFRASADSPKPKRWLDEDLSTWSQLRDGLHAISLELGPTWLQLAKRRDVVPASMNGRSCELWQPILALSALVEDAGADGLLLMMQRHALRNSELQGVEVTPEADELLLRLLAASVQDGANASLTPGELLKRAREREPSLFATWTGRGVGAALKRYHITTMKSNGRRIYRVTPTQLRQIEAAYSLDLGLATYPTCPTCPEAALARISHHYDGFWPQARRTAVGDGETAVGSAHGQRTCSGTWGSRRLSGA